MTDERRIFMNIHELIINRESCRSYAPKPVSADQLRAIVDVARMAPSASNSQPWRFYASASPDAVAKIAKGCTAMGHNEFVLGAPAFIVMTKPVEAEAGVPKTPYNHYYQDFDCGGAAAHICFAATEIGLSTCMLGWFDEAPIKEACGYGDGEAAVIVFSVGYATGGALRDKKRNALADVLTVIE